MASIHLTETTTATPEQLVAGLMNFGPGLTAHDRERLQIDRSDPDRVVITTTDSKEWGGATGQTYTFRRKLDGKTVVDVVVVREGKNLKGRLHAMALGSAGTREMAKTLHEAIAAIEAQNPGHAGSSNSPAVC
jgi:hypothetical protein